ncbi:dTDP-4-dehydrorhamnose 3,5-epimerase [Pectobacterium punjabense]|uniref:dTDP-4-dehydrorhamnose 3,5-epimerase n=1 Tax=Pectobacterium punjabense TaxID=2108399 RepID=UPI0019697D84|nr:dTDP-4-dehydrorhamnose 3,5-epimerase [Pectobacterium punjabense]MBN3137857.1 dTDP-4-dehydrorhamnose 3,5-epimerase [Pectobacterium punjabense]MCE5379758.1 dTDP-4-dehydrorhamnose 3,5-epimerase [Pectobacterium punjabense]
MKFIPTAVDGAFEIELEGYSDERGFFARAFCANEFASQNLVTHFLQCNLSLNPQRGTLRGMHFQCSPQAEVKLVRAIRGRVFDVALDLRPESHTYMAWAAVELDASQHNAFYIPQGCAHGFLTLEDNSDLFYQVSEFYTPTSESGVRWNDPVFDIQWPNDPTLISQKDANHSDYRR